MVHHPVPSSVSISLAILYGTEFIRSQGREQVSDSVVALASTITYVITGNSKQSPVTFSGTLGRGSANDGVFKALPRLQSAPLLAASLLVLLNEEWSLLVQALCPPMCSLGPIVLCHFSVAVLW